MRPETRVDLGPRWPALVVDDDPDDYPREFHDAAEELLSMALTEVGYSDRDQFWNGTAYANRNPVPWQVLYRARELVCRKLGLAYHWEDESDELVMTKAAIMREEAVE